MIERPKLPENTYKGETEIFFKDIKTDNTMVDLSKYSWWQKDKYGWPIEKFEGRPVLNFFRTICQNIRKITR